MQYSKNNAYSGIRVTPYRVHFGRVPADLSVEMTLPKEVMERLETEDDLCGVLESRQVIGYASFYNSSDSILCSLLPSSSLPAETDDNSYDIPVPPLIGSEFTPYFDLATVTPHQVAPALPSV